MVLGPPSTRSREARAPSPPQSRSSTWHSSEPRSRSSSCAHVLASCRSRALAPGAEAAGSCPRRPFGALFSFELFVAASAHKEGFTPLSDAVTSA